ncbi:unnamed protein product [Aureobasidium vineae]|uniref:Uncharacterized protein n=1 Tax=Aureobasidium vineae TaxID=2773715 RepID=A0A9N8JDV7_9PEZI|nr:unnamed protein product [Aureobasidium vineae]
MRETQTSFVWFALLGFARSVVSEKADCGDGLELNALQGVESTFSIPVKKPCSAALITFSDGTDSMLDPRTNTSCHNPTSEAQTFATVIGSDAPEGIATLTFQCSEQVYCMSINVAEGNGSDSQTSIRSVCANLTNPSHESSGAATGATQVPKVSDEPAHQGSTLTSQSDLSITTTSPSGSNGLGTSLGAGVLGNATYATGLDSIGLSQSASQTLFGMSAGTTPTTSSTWAASPSRTSNVSIFQTTMVSLYRTDTIMPATTTAPPDDADAITSKSATTLNDDNSTEKGTDIQLPYGNQSRESKSSSDPTVQPITAYPLQNDTRTTSSTQAASQDPSTCACYPLPTF